VKEKLKIFWENFNYIFSKREISILPGHLAYFLVLSIVPIISLITYIASSFNLPVDLLNDFIKESFSADIAKLLTPILNHTSVSPQNFLILFTAFIIASNGTHSIILASNMIFNLPNSTYIRRRIKAFIMTIIMILLFTFILIFPVFGTSIINFLAKLSISEPTIDVIKYIHELLTWPISILVIFFFIKLTFTIAPDDKMSSKYVNKGALFTTFFWILITYFYSYYVNNMINYNIYYGALSNIVVLMFWFYLMSLALVIGLVLNHRSMEENIERTNSIKLEEIKDKVNKSIKI
jgi:membrane protein